MAVLSQTHVSSADVTVSSPGISAEQGGSGAKVQSGGSNAPILSPSTVSQVSQEDNNTGGDDDSENDNNWKGQSWSQEDVRFSSKYKKTYHGCCDRQS